MARAESSDAILLHIGTNDILQGTFDGADGRLYDLINQIYTDAPNVVLFVAKIIPNNNDPSYNPQVDAFNQSVEDIVGDFQGAGASIILVDANSGFDRSQTSKDLAKDMIHPSLIGYQKLAVRWANAVNRAAVQGYFGNSSPRGNFTPVSLQTFPRRADADTIFDSGLRRDIKKGEAGFRLLPLLDSTKSIYKNKSSLALRIIQARR